MKKRRLELLIVSILLAITTLPVFPQNRTALLGVSGTVSIGGTPLNCTPVQTGSGTDSGDNNRALGVNCTIASSMTVTSCIFSINTTASGNGRCGIYATTATTPTGNALALSSSTALVSGTNTQAISASLAAGVYFIGINLSSASTVVNTHPTGCVAGTRWTSTTGATYPNFPTTGAAWNDVSVCLNISLAGTTP